MSEYSERDLGWGFWVLILAIVGLTFYTVEWGRGVTSERSDLSYSKGIESIAKYSATSGPAFLSSVSGDFRYPWAETPLFTLGLLHTKLMAVPSARVSHARSPCLQHVPPACIDQLIMYFSLSRDFEALRAALSLTFPIHDGLISCHCLCSQAPRHMCAWLRFFLAGTENAFLC